MEKGERERAMSTIVREDPNGLSRQRWTFGVEWSWSNGPVFVVQSYNEQRRRAKRTSCEWVTVGRGREERVVDPPPDVVAEFRERLAKAPIFASYAEAEKDRAHQYDGKLPPGRTV